MNDVFADIFNVLVFGGQQIVIPDSLEDMVELSQYKADDNKLHEQERDTYKLWKGLGINRYEKISLTKIFLLEKKRRTR